MYNLDGLRQTLGCRDGETVFEAAERVVRERDIYYASLVNAGMMLDALGFNDEIAGEEYLDTL